MTTPLERGEFEKSEFVDMPLAGHDVAASLSMADANSTLAEVSHHRASTNEVSQIRHYRYPVALFAIILFVILLISLTILLAGGKEGPIYPSFETVINYLIKFQVSSAEALMTHGTPENQAARWMAHIDPAQLYVPRSWDYAYTTRYVLALLYYTTNGSNWTDNVGFLSKASICDWNDSNSGTSTKPIPTSIKGLTCDINKEAGSLYLEYNNLEGYIPTELALLTSLQNLALSVNALAGTIPTEFGSRLTRLETIALSNNEFTGSLFDFAVGMILRDVRIDDNHFTGSIPISWCHLTELEVLIARHNYLDGRLSPCIENWTRLRRLILSNNAFRGELPVELAALDYLEYLWLDDNEFHGDPTLVISQLTSLSFLFLENNLFTGDLNEDFCRNHDHLVGLDLSWNKFSSISFPSHLIGLPSLRFLALGRNELKGSIPEEIAANDKLWLLSLHNNQLTGRIPIALRNLTALFFVDLSDNDLSGSIPEVIFEMSSLRRIFLNNLFRLDASPIPSLARIPKLQKLSLRNSRCTGPLPDMSGLSSITLLDLDYNDFSGRIPSHYGTLSHLQYLFLSRNPLLEGPVPDFSSAMRLEILTLDGTKVTGDLASVCTLPSFVRTNFSAFPQEPQGQQALPSLAVADCADSARDLIRCECCRCCGRFPCSDALVANLTGTWEDPFRQRQGHEPLITLGLIPGS